MKLTSGHFESNSLPILSVLRQELPDKAHVLEIASGPGQHAAFFAEELPSTNWQASDIDIEYMPSLRAYATDARYRNLKEPLLLDVCEEWPVKAVDAIVSINLLHVSPWQACCGVLKNAGRVLSPDGLLFFYGPFIRPDVETAQSNLMFNARLKHRDPQWGVRELVKVAEEAGKYGLKLKTVYDLPSNNVIVIFAK